MTDEQARKAQNPILRIRSTLTDATLSEIETTAAIDGWLHLVKAEAAPALPDPRAPAPIPLPASVWLLLVAVAGLTWIGRR